MMVSLFSAKGSPGVTSTALAITAVWPRPVVLLEADPSGSDLVYRCQSAAGGPAAPSPNVLGFASAVRGDRSASLSEWVQKLACGVDLVPGVTTPSQSRGMAGSWRAVATAARAAETDVIVDLGQLHRESVTIPLVVAADVRIPVVTGTLESLMHTRELLKDLTVEGGGRTLPLLVGRARTATADSQDVDEVMASAGVIAAASTHIPLDHPGLSALEAGANSTGRGRASQLIRGARTVVEHLMATTEVEANS